MKIEFKDIYENINIKSVVIGAAIFAFIVVLGYRNNILEILSIFSTVGLLYIGYASQNKLQGIILGAIGTLPLGIGAAFFELLGKNMGTNNEILIIVSFLAIGAFCGFTGAYFSVSRKKAIEEKMKEESMKAKNKYKK